MTDKKELPKEEKKQLLEEQQKHEQIASHEHKLLKESSEQHSKDLEDQLKRLQAEFENYKKRVSKEKEELSANASATIIKKLLHVVEELEIAVNHAQSKHAKTDDLAHGFEMVLTNMRAVLEKEGLREMKCEGEQFDPYKHEAMRSEESDVEEGKITAVVKKGYYFKDKVLRHAGVVVSKEKIKGDKNE